MTMIASSRSRATIKLDPALVLDDPDESGIGRPALCGTSGWHQPPK
jgi:hypothetical protein